MDIIVDFLIHKILYRVGFTFLYLITGGKFKDNSSYYLYLIVLVGGLVVAAPLVIFVLI